MRANELLIDERRRLADAEHSIMEAKLEAQARKIERDAAQQQAFLDMTRKMELNAKRQADSVLEKERHEENVRKIVFENLFAEVVEECKAYNEKIAADQNEKVLPQHFKVALEPEPPHDSDDEDTGPKAGKKRAAEPQRGLLSFFG